MQTTISYINNHLKQHPWSAALIVAGIIHFLAFNQPPDLFFSNQHSYFPHGIALAGQRPFTQVDWYSQTQPAHIVFTYYLALLETLHSLAVGAYLTEMLLAFTLLIAIYLLVKWYYNALSENILFLSAPPKPEYIAAIWLLFIIWLPIVNLNGLAAQGIFSGYLQPSDFGTLILLALALIAFERYWLAVILCGVASLFQASYLIHTSAIVGILCVYLLISDKDWKRALSLGVLYALIVAPIAVYSYNLSLGPIDGADAIRILGTERIAHHALPSVWFDRKATLRLVLMIVSSAVIFRGSRGALRWIVAVGVGYAALFTFIVYLTNNPRLGLLFPWRASAYLYPLALITLTTTLSMVVIRLASRRYTNPMRPLSAVLIGILIGNVYFAAAFVPLKQAARTTGYEDFARSASDIVAPDELIIIPLVMEDYRLTAQRPVYVDAKNHPYRPDEVVEWDRRIKQIEAFYSFPGDEQPIACAELGASYYVDLVIDLTPAEQTRVTQTNDQLALVRCQ